MRSFKDIYLAIGLLAVSTSSAWMSFHALEEVDRPLTTYTTPFSPGEAHYILWEGDKCIGTLRSNASTEVVHVEGQALVSFEGRTQIATGESKLQLNPLGHVVHSDTQLVYDTWRVAISSRGTTSLELTFDTSGRSKKNLRHFTLPGPIIVTRSEHDVMEIQHPYLSRTLSFFEALMNNQFKISPKLRKAEGSTQTPDACNLAESHALDVSEFVTRISALTRAWENLTAGSEE